MLKICITGHRDLMNPADVRKDIAYSLKYFKETDSPIITFSALAAGADLLFAEEAISLHLPLRVMLPFSLEEYKKDFNRAELEQLEKVLQKTPYEIFHKSAINNPDERNKAYLETGQKMVDDSDIVLAVWDGKPAGGSGGTGDIVEYAKAKGKQLHIIKGIRKSRRVEPAQPDEAQEAFDKLDAEAIKYKKKRFEPSWVAGIIAGLLAVFCFATGLVFPLSHTVKFIFSCGEIIFLFTSFVLLAVYAKKWKHIFLNKRRDAEYLRAVLWYKEAGIPIPEIKKTKYKPGDEILEIEKKVAAGVSTIANVPNAKRIAWCLAEEQMDYHTGTRINPFTERLKKMEQWLTAFKIIFFIVAPINFILESMEHFEVYTGLIPDFLQPYLLFLSLVLPPLYAALEGIKYFGEWKRNIAVSAETVEELTEIKGRILLCTDEKSLLPETKILRNILEIENNDWAVRYDEKEVGSKL